jgi:hypothetical protein
VKKAHGAVPNLWFMKDMKATILLKWITLMKSKNSADYRLAAIYKYYLNKGGDYNSAMVSLYIITKQPSFVIYGPNGKKNISLKQKLKSFFRII